MSKCKVLFTSMAVVVLFCGSLQAGLVNFSANVSLQTTPTGVYLKDTLSSIPSVITMTAEFVVPSGLQSLNASYSTFTVKLDAFNNLTWTWTGYRLEVVGDPPDSATFTGTAYCDKFGGTPDTGNQYMLEWMEGSGHVLPREHAIFEFDLSLGISPDKQQYTFTLIQTPIPEPATIALLGLGTLALLARRHT